MFRNEQRLEAAPCTKGHKAAEMADFVSVAQATPAPPCTLSARFGMKQAICTRSTDAMCRIVFVGCRIPTVFFFNHAMQQSHQQNVRIRSLPDCVHRAGSAALLALCPSCAICSRVQRCCCCRAAHMAAAFSDAQPPTPHWTPLMRMACWKTLSSGASSSPRWGAAQPWGLLSVVTPWLLMWVPSPCRLIPPPGRSI